MAINKTKIVILGMIVFAGAVRGGSCDAEKHGISTPHDTALMQLSADAARHASANLDGEDHVQRTAPVCAHDSSWQYVLDYHDDRSTDDIPDDTSTIGAGFTRANAFYIGHAALDALDIEEAEVCALASVDPGSYDCNAACATLTEDDMFLGAGGGCFSGMTAPVSKVKKMIAVLSGACGNSGHKDYIEWNSSLPNGPHFGGARSAVPWACQDVQMIKKKPWAQWHSGAYGITLVASPQGATNYNYEFGFYDNTCATSYGNSDFYPLVDTLHIRVRTVASPTTSPTSSPTFATPTASPTTSPTFAGPTASPTASPPTSAPAPTSASATVAATGDPHLQNVFGQRFDLMQPGIHTLVNIPRSSLPEHAMFRVTALAHHLGGACAELYFQSINVTGEWTHELLHGGVRFDAGNGSKPGDLYMGRWLSAGPARVKVVRGHLHDGGTYLNLYLKDVRNIGFHVGGLLGEDSHDVEATAGPRCKMTVQLRELRFKKENIGALESSKGSQSEGTVYRDVWQPKRPEQLGSVAKVLLD